MKKIITLVVAVLATATVANAQFGVIGGFTSSKTTIDTKDIKANFEGVSLYHAGIAYKQNLALGFALQPQLTFEMKGTKLSEVEGTSIKDFNLETQSGYIELGCGVQWGVDLLVARPFVFAEPFLGYQVLTKSASEFAKNFDGYKNKLEYGFGLGVGVDVVKHIQVSVQWFKNLGKLYSGENVDGNAVVNNVVGNVTKDFNSYQGIKVSLGIFF